jgi:NAD-dependent dihydropyrimidine dehydrogenase PreA subunit
MRNAASALAGVFSPAAKKSTRLTGTKKSVVVHPNQCLDGCKTCPHLCPSEVIRFARRRYTRKAKAQRLIERRKILPAFKKELNDDEELTNER